MTELLTVSLEVRERSRRHAAFHRCFRHRRRDTGNEAWIEGLGDDVVGAETDFLAFVSHCHDIGLLGLGKLGNRLHARELHLVGDTRSPHVQRTAEDEREAQYVVDLVRIVRAAGGDDAVRPHRFRELWPDFRLGIGQREDERLVRHLLDHVLGHHSRSR